MRMRIVGSGLIAAVVALGCGSPGPERAPDSPPTTSAVPDSRLPPSPSAEVTRAEVGAIAELVFADPATKTARLRQGGPGSEEVTLPLESEALAAIDRLRPGDPVEVRCRTNPPAPSADASASPAAPGVQPSLTICTSVIAMAPGRPAGNR